MRRGKQRWVIAAGLCVVATAQVARACDYHWALGLPEPTGVWPTPSESAVASLNSASGAVALLKAQDSVTDAAITHWMLNTTGVKGHSTNATINATVSQILADVQTVAYNSTDVYIHATGIPSHDVGPFSGNPATPTDRNRTVRIPRQPQENKGTKTAVGYGAVGVMVNGVVFFDPRDAATYNNQGVWHQNANKFEATSFDSGKGHPAPDMQNTSTGNYHYHQAPLSLLNELDPGNTGQHHSPLLGFAYDGFPVYGPYGYKNSDGTGGIVRETSSYALRTITDRTTLPDGTTATFPGPTLAQQPLGSYVEDYGYTAGSGLLDQYNGRFTITPDYPQGTYAYFMSLDNTNTSVYPYIIGPNYYGVVATDDIAPGGTITVPGNVVYYTVPEPATAMIPLCVAGAALLRRRRGV